MRLKCSLWIFERSVLVGVCLHLSPVPDVLDHLCWKQRGTLSNDHSRPPATSPQESQRWGEKAGKKRRTPNMREAVFALREAERSKHLWNHWVTDRKISQVWMFIRQDWMRKTIFQNRFFLTNVKNSVDCLLLINTDVKHTSICISTNKI